MAGMRLLVLADARSVHTERWCGYFEQAGYEVALFSLEEKKISTSAKFYQAGSRIPLKFLNYFLAKKEFLRVVDDFKPDVINAHYVVSYGYLASFCQTVPIVDIAWGSDLLLMPQRSPFHRKRIARALRNSSVCIVDGANLAAVAVEYIPEDKIHKMVWGVDRGVLNRNLVPRDKSKEKHPVRIIAPRGLPDVYDPMTIIKAAQLLQGQMEFKIILRGEDELIPRYIKIIEEHHLTSIIELMPFIESHAKHLDDLPNYDIYLSASLSDSTSVSLLEAMAVGLFPLVSDIPGNKDWITTGQNGLTFKPGSTEALAEAIQKAVGTKDQFEQIAERNRKIISERAIWQDQMTQVEKLIDGLVR